ncbi:MAG: DUF4286 family protein [Saprospiraceae bacterium]|nr:DUF4286 family protein [Saprospiraceae bacterium]
MVIYNVTVKVSTSMSAKWIQWMKTKHIPEVMHTGCFLEYKLCKLIGDDNEDGITFAVQYLCKDMDALENYQKHHAKGLQADHSANFGGHFAAFRSVLEVIE